MLLLSAPSSILSFSLNLHCREIARAVNVFNHEETLCRVGGRGRGAFILSSSRSLIHAANKSELSSQRHRDERAADNKKNFMSERNIFEFFRSNSHADFICYVKTDTEKDCLDINERYWNHLSLTLLPEFRTHVFCNFTVKFLFLLNIFVN